MASNVESLRGCDTSFASNVSNHLQMEIVWINSRIVSNASHVL